MSESIQMTANQVVVVNNSQGQISVRVTKDNETGTVTTGFKDIEPGKHASWNRTHWQVAYVLKERDVSEGNVGKAETLVMKPPGIYYVNDY